MKLKILGSGGGEGYPAVFCGCMHCQKARQAGGKNLRTLSQALIDDSLVIDLPADTHMHVLTDRINLGDVENILITHTHADHYYPNIFELRGGVFAHNLKYKQVRIYGNAQVKSLFESIYSHYPIDKDIKSNIIFINLTPYRSVKIGKYTVTPLHANHAPDQTSLNYIVEDGKSSLLYLLDSGVPTEETFAYMAASGKRFDCVVADGTMGECAQGTYVYHMGFQENISLKERLLSAGNIKDETKFVVSHITHNDAGLHEEIEERFNPYGISVAYDGMELKF